jgi:hypothetical protein
VTTTRTTTVVATSPTPAVTSGVTPAPTVPDTPAPTVSTAVTHPCVVTSSNVQFRSLSSRLSQLKRTAVVHLRVRATCGLRLTVAATLRGSPKVVVASAAVSVKRGQTRIVLVHLTAAGRKLLAGRREARLLLTTRTPAVKAITPKRVWTTAITLSA